MTTIPPRRPVTDALLAMLAAVTLRPVGDGDAQWSDDDLPYLVVEQLPGGVSGGDVSHPHGMAEVVWQVTAVGSVRKSAEIAMDNARAAILDKDADGWVNDLPALPTVVFSRSWDSDAGLTVDGPVVSISERFRLGLMPSPLP